MTKPTVFERPMSSATGRHSLSAAAAASQTGALLERSLSSSQLTQVGLAKSLGRFERSSKPSC
jgi:hypothetical protein